MIPADVLKHEPKILTAEQRRCYCDNGYLLVENAVPPEWVERLLAATDEMVDKSRALIDSDALFDLDPGPPADPPRLGIGEVPGQNRSLVTYFGHPRILG